MKTTVGKIFVCVLLLVTTLACASLFSACSESHYFITLHDGDEAFTTVLTDEEGYVTLPTPEKQGYVFENWYYDSNLTQTYSPTDKFTEASDLYCKFVGNEYIITLDVNGGNVPETTTVTVRSGEDYTHIPIPTREYYKFIGWEYDGQIVDAGQPFTFASDVVLTATWKPVERIITYDSNGGVLLDENGNEVIGNLVSQTFVYGESRTPYSARKDGLTFIGWVTEDGKEIFTDLWISDESVTAIATYA
ncbi:MAG: InlB B-repeat-containing protein [Clostridia bacterium]|nr:InlB B-repeat-containing protein [Clostridia bacterium]